MPSIGIDNFNMKLFNLGAFLFITELGPPDKIIPDGLSLTNIVIDIL